MPKLLRILPALLLLQSAQLIAQESWYLDPGVKFGYAFGERGGFISGIEVSLIRVPNSPHVMTGVCVSVERLNALTIAHIGFEVGGLVGISVGPTMLISNQSKQLGLTTTVYGGLLILPYFRYTYVPQQADIPEVGSFVKLAVKLSGPSFRFGEGK